MNVIDSRDLGTAGGFDIRAYLVPDNDVTPMTNGDYGQDDIEAWRSGDWCYVSVIVTASKDDTELGRSSLSGCEHGWFPGITHRVSPLTGDGDNFCNGYGSGLINEAVTAAAETLSHLSV